jgi:hypothetical protein
MIAPIKVFKRLIPLCFIDTDMLLCYRFGKIYALNFYDFSIEMLMKFNFSWKYNILSCIKIIARCLRFDVRYGIKITQNKFIIVRNKYLYEIDIKTKIISHGYKLTRGSRPLNIVHINKIEGFDSTLYYGEYFRNYKQKPVFIYKRIDKDKWKKVYKFQAGEINHIHNLIPDKTNKCVWILTGDFGKSSAIWQARNNFKEVEPICREEQIFRSCAAFPYNEGLIYATDTSFQKNSLRFLHKENKEWKTTLISEINGPVIYSANITNGFIFSTVVESNGGEPLLKKIFTFKRGNGIIKNEAVVYKITNNTSPIEIIRNKKDILPLFLFQYGSICFPTGNNQSVYLPVYNIGTKKYDLSLALYKLT